MPILTSLEAMRLDAQQMPEIQGCSVERWIPLLLGQERKSRIKTARFAVKQMGDSMSALGTSFPEGMLLIFDITRRNPESGELCCSPVGRWQLRIPMVYVGRYPLFDAFQPYANYQGSSSIIGT